MTASHLPQEPPRTPSPIPDTTPVGTWTATVRLPQETVTAEFRFTRTGEVALRTSVGSTGRGTWTPTAHADFIYLIEEYFPGDDGSAGWIAIEQEAVWRHHGFHSCGTSTVHDSGGGLIAVVEVTVSATRVDPADPDLSTPDDLLASLDRGSTAIRSRIENR